jgi:2-methylcitrate dehydratase
VDGITRQLVEFATAFDFDALPQSVRDAAVNHVVDSVAVAVAGYRSEPAQVAIRLAREATADRPATVFGSGVRTTPELAAFANAVMVRAWDWNDGMFAQGGGHPSDMLSGLLAVAEPRRLSGRELLAALTLSYEVLGSLGNSAPVRQRGWDQGTFMGAATALGVGMLMGLDETRLADAVSLAVVPNVPLNVTRVGALSMWKGCATAAAVRNAVFAAELAERGMTGPAEPFEGGSGLWQLVTGPFELALPAYPGGRKVVEISHLKQFPAEAHSQALLREIPRIRRWAPADRIESIEVEIYWIAYDEIGSHPAKWDPHTRETADHSLPYLLAAAWVDGDITLRSFTPERIEDPALRPLMNRISIRENPEYTAAYRPAGMEIAGNPRARIVVRRDDGAVLDEEVTFPRGHSMNPMTKDDITAKFRAASLDVLDPDRAEQVAAAWWRIQDVTDVSVLLRTVADFGPAPETRNEVPIGSPARSSG